MNGPQRSKKEKPFRSISTFHQAEISDYFYKASLMSKTDVFSKVQNTAFDFGLFPAWARDDFDVVLLAAKNKVSSLQYASERLRANKDVVLIAVAQPYPSLHFASESLRNEKSIVLTAVLFCWCNLESASDELKNDSEVVLTAIKSNGCSLKYASEELKNNYDIVLATVSNNYKAIKYASDKLKINEKILLTVFKSPTSADLMLNLPQSVKCNKDLVLKIIQQNVNIVQYISDKLRADEDVIISAVKINGAMLKYAKYELRNNKNIVFTAVSQSWTALQYASENMQSDYDVVLAAVSNNGRALQYALGTTLYNKTIICEVIRGADTSTIIPYIIPPVMLENPDVIVTALSQPKCSQWIKSSALNDAYIVRKLLFSDKICELWVHQKLQMCRKIYACPIPQAVMDLLFVLV